MTAPTLEPHDPNCGDVFTAGEFARLVRAGAMIRSDGDGYWATADGHDMSSSVWSTPKPSWATHVAWFNK